MVPVTEVAFMPGTVASESVMVGLGEDYYVERSPREARTILRRRMEGVCHRRAHGTAPGSKLMLCITRKASTSLYTFGGVAWHLPVNSMRTTPGDATAAVESMAWFIFRSCECFE